MWLAPFMDEMMHEVSRLVNTYRIERRLTELLTGFDGDYVGAGVVDFITPAEGGGGKPSDAGLVFGTAITVGEEEGQLLG